MRNLTITVKEDVARWARIRAAERETSVSRMVGEVLERMMLDDAEYEEALRRFERHRPRTLNPAGRLPSREALHERTGVR